MKSLAIRVGLIILLVGLGSCAAGFGVSRSGGSGAVATLRDVGIIILACISLVIAAAWGSIYFGAAWTIGRFGGKALAAPRWVQPMAFKFERAMTDSTERMVIRPLAATSRAVTAGATLVDRIVNGPSDDRGWDREVRGWPTLMHRLRGRAAVPVAARRAVAQDSEEPNGARERIHAG